MKGRDGAQYPGTVCNPLPAGVHGGLRPHHTPFIRIWINTPGPQGIARIRVLGEVLNAAFKMGMGAMLQDRDHCGGLRFRRHSGGARIYLTSRAELRNRSKRHEPPIGGSVSRDGSAAPSVCLKSICLFAVIHTRCAPSPAWQVFSYKSATSF